MSDMGIEGRVLKTYQSVSPGGRPPKADGRGELDSMAFLEFIAGLEREFSLSIDVKDLTDANFATLHATTAFIQRRLG